MGAVLMSLRAAFEYWCDHHGYTRRSSVYLASGGTSDLDNYEARIVRGVEPADRAGRHRNPQTYVVELRECDTISYPLGASWFSKQQLLAAMISDTMKGKDNE
jgi:hypothetical protein